jgi:hypothetical protein
MSCSNIAQISSICRRVTLTPKAINVDRFVAQSTIDPMFSSAID